MHNNVLMLNNIDLINRMEYCNKVSSIFVLDTNLVIYIEKITNYVRNVTEYAYFVQRNLCTFVLIYCEPCSL